MLKLSKEGLFFNFVAKTLDNSFTSRLRSDNGLQFCISRLSLSLVSISLITACFCDALSFPFVKAYFRLAIREFFKSSQKAS